MAVVDPKPSDGAARSREGALAEVSRLAVVGLVCGVLGSTALIFGFVLYALDPELLPLSLGNAGIGVAGILFYMVTNRRTFARALGDRSTPFVALEVAVFIGALAAVVVVNYFAAQQRKEWDLTRGSLYSLQEESIRVAKSLDKKVIVYGFFRSTEDATEVLRESVGLYRAHTDLISLELINPDAPPPELVKKFDLNLKSPRIIVSSETGQFKKLVIPTEEGLTNALVAVADRPARKVIFLGGHGNPKVRPPGDTVQQLQPEAYDNAVSRLRNEGYAVEEVSLVDKEAVPAGTSLVILAGSNSPLFPHEALALKAWVNQGGALLLLLEPGIEHGLDAFFKPLGLVVDNTLVLEPNPAGIAQGFGMESPVIQNYEPHPITRTLQRAATMFFRSRSVQPKVGLANIEVATLLQTGPESWGETNITAEGAPERDEDDIPGPVPLALALTKRTAMVQNKISDEARVVVFGDHHFASNRFIVMGANGELFRNAANWALGEDERITIRAKERKGDHLPLTQVEHYGIMFFSVNLMPLLIIGFGFSVWAVRRRK